ncbi:ABC transporter permease [Cyclobacterium plantarum]|uniref:FtsX-like permease family protein n=1 Tax=Cyclobacterium plantarum TaxID=2716263 RepID=A0ABX0H840_9BACT|nr:FtsX-like permease family protein [Cyclobacterium plantarum]NHE56386.1 FtsX-like permease family protein [Cyclobacterium plantarum]
MWKNYLKIAYRNLMSNKVFSTINILGLAVGMGVCLLIFQYIHFELSYDRFHPNSEQIYRLTQTINKRGEIISYSPFTTNGLGAEAKTNLPEIEDLVRVNFLDLSLVVINPDDQLSHQEDRLLFVDPGFLDLFHYPLKYGDKVSVFQEKHGIVITERMAVKYFGDNNPVGKTLETSGGVMSGSFVVSGVLEPLLENSHLQFDFLFPLDFLISKYGRYKSGGGWDWDDFVTYVSIQDHFNPIETVEKFEDIITLHKGEELEKLNEKWKIGLQPLTEIHLYSNFTRDFETNNGNLRHLWFFAIVASFILLMAWVNYVNLTTSQAMLRSKEVGIRKSIGADKGQLISQFMLEAVLVNFTAAVLALALSAVLLPVLQELVGKNIYFTLLSDPIFWVGFILTVGIGTLLSGLYPAFVLTSFRPVNLIKTGGFNPTSNWSLRKSLIVFQFFVSLLLIAGTYLVYQQVLYMKNQELGMDVEEILVIDGPRVIIESVIENGTTLSEHYQAFKNQATMQHSISSVTSSSSVPGKGYIFESMVRKSTDPDETLALGNFVLMDKDFIPSYGLEFIANTEIPENIPDWTYVLINEAALEALDFGSADAALGQEVEFFSYKTKILGVVKNFHWDSLKDSYSPTFYILDNAYGVYFSVRMNKSDIQGTIAHLKQSYEKVFPGDPFSYFFLDEEFNRQYQADLQFGKLFTSFSSLAVFMACLGLFALVSFSASMKTKEIGIRKVLGATSRSLIGLLTREYLYLLLLAVILTVPVIYFWGNSWLENFAFRINIGIAAFLVPGAIMLVIAMVTVMGRILSTTRENPVKALKAE